MFKLGFKHHGKNTKYQFWCLRIDSPFGGAEIGFKSNNSYQLETKDWFILFLGHFYIIAKLV